MSAVTQTTLLRVAPGQMGAFLKRSSKMKKIRERAGAKVRYYRTVTGANVPAIVVVAETGGWKAFGEYMAKLEADPEWQKLRAEVRAEGAGIEIRLSEEIEV